ncbi:zinc dependent phospholipase C family protein [Anaeromicropila herbilytica]|uniref:Phospholipase C/D domain-containing protein n=1 Tax=Anaeromicropila herbilytica TaxID=2785025 RepID=A0A7R7ICB9_9FIRM|nr:zinc dependent phospholipase C family protein [Anaeromicropila herbilytica]BCN30573.1 hypothetical protein bsdtb5_18680 [Anaeromicropila herbilytica]
MPGTYAHYTFGEEVLNNLNGEVKSIIKQNHTLYDIGLHGPDILFFYKPYTFNYVNQRGMNLHKKSGNEFFIKANKMLKNAKESDSAKAYLFGFVCHYMLDSECHPYVNQKEKLSKISHSEIETEFERYMMAKNHLDPMFYKPTKHLMINERYAECISNFFPGISSEKIMQSIKSMKFYVDLFNAPRIWKGNILHFITKPIDQNKVSGLFMTRKENPACIDSNLVLEKLYQKSIGATVKIIEEYYKNMEQLVTKRVDLESLNQRFQKSFD